MSRRCTCGKPCGKHRFDCTFGSKMDEPYHAPIQDFVNHPSHYTNHPSGIECIQVTEHLNFCIGNAMKYLWRAGEKGNYIQDLEKAAWYINREIARCQR